MTEEELDAIEKASKRTSFKPTLGWYKETLPKLIEEVRKLQGEVCPVDANIKLNQYDERRRYVLIDSGVEEQMFDLEARDAFRLVNLIRTLLRKRDDK